MTAEILAATEHLVLRRMTNHDAAALAAYRSDPVQARYQSGRRHTPSRAH
jgi:aminoglycoside 6'-N-acetyltransferase